jgi:hypothetical protein
MHELARVRVDALSTRRRRRLRLLLVVVVVVVGPRLAVERRSRRSTNERRHALWRLAFLDDNVSRI